jgi:hypothetical protein
MAESAMRLGFMLVAALPLVLSVAAVAFADDPMQLAVVSYGKIPAGSAFQTELTDNTELASQVETSLKKALGNHGFSAADDAPYVISIAADRTGGSTNLSVGNTGQSNAQVNINIDTGQNKLLGGSNQAPEKMARAYRITLAIYNKATGRYIWRAEITDPKPDVDPVAATGPMVEKLASALEKSAAPQ